MALILQTTSEPDRKTTVSTRLSLSQLKAFEDLAQSRAVTPARLLREMILSELQRQDAAARVDLVLAEIVGVRLLLVNLLKPQVTGQVPLTATGFESLLEEVKKVKRQVALGIQLESSREIRK